MVDYLYVDLESGNLKASVKGGLSGVPGQWHPVIWVNTLGDTPNDRIMSTIAGIRSWLQGSHSIPVSNSAIIETPVDLTILDSETTIQEWTTTLNTKCSPNPFPYIILTLLGKTVLQISYASSANLPLEDEKLWVKIEHNPAKPGTIQLPGGISCEECDSDPNEGIKPAQPATPGGSGGRPGGPGGGGGGEPVPGPGGGGAPSAPAPFPGPEGACEDCIPGGEGEPSPSSGGEGEGEPSDSASGGSWGVWYGGDE